MFREGCKGREPKKRSLIKGKKVVVVVVVGVVVGVVVELVVTRVWNPVVAIYGALHNSGHEVQLPSSDCSDRSREAYFVTRVIIAELFVVFVHDFLFLDCVLNLKNLVVFETKVFFFYFFFFYFLFLLLFIFPFLSSRVAHFTRGR